jgi:hypothetical protein
MVKAPLRNKSISSKVTEEEYSRLESLADSVGLSMSEWVRTLLMDRLGQSAVTEREEVLLSELLGLRTFLLNVLFKVAKGERMSGEDMQAVIEKADAAKKERARKLLAFPGPAPVEQPPESPKERVQ